MNCFANTQDITDRIVCYVIPTGGKYFPKESTSKNSQDITDQLTVYTILTGTTYFPITKVFIKNVI